HISRCALGIHERDELLALHVRERIQIDVIPGDLDPELAAVRTLDVDDVSVFRKTHLRPRLATEAAHRLGVGIEAIRHRMNLTRPTCRVA
ncbi:MAG TPA: hypothetical protein VGM50_04900, partial [Gemmatimonadaceae bacterium]